MSKFVFGGTMGEMDEMKGALEGICLQALKLELYQEYWSNYGYNAGGYSFDMVQEVIDALKTAVAAVSSVLDGTSSEEQRELLRAYFAASDTAPAAPPAGEGKAGAGAPTTDGEAEGDEASKR